MLSRLVRIRSLIDAAAKAIWLLPGIVIAALRAAAEEERDVALKAADAGMTADEWRRANAEAGL